MRLAALGLLVAVVATPALAQHDTGHAPPPAQQAPTQQGQPTAQEGMQHAVTTAGHEPQTPPAGGDIIMPHITDSPHFEIPWFNSHFAKVVHLPQWPPLHIGGLTIDLSPTKHVVMLLVAATLCCIVLILAARGHKRHAVAGGAPRGLPNGIEAVVLYLRNEIIMPNVGHHGEKYVPFLLSLFFFILFANVLGLIPYGATATGNISVTAMLAIMSFVMVEIAGMRELGAGYIKTIVYWPHDMPVAMKAPLTLILTPVEIIGKFTKPFALAVRLFANMTAGHVIVLAFIGMIFTFGSWVIAPLPFLMAVAIMLLEVLVAFIQAFIFTLLTSVFIGQIRAGAH
jgi:F-type H+-transporting ATPase subunit a